MDSPVERLLPLAIEASLQAGEAILRVYRTDFEVERKADHSPLTQADQDAHKIIQSTLLKASSLPLLSEEGRAIPYSERKSWERFWMVDPMDGTKEFVHKNGEFTVNIALIQDQKPVLGVVYVPVQEKLYFAAKGWGCGLMEKITFSNYDPKTILSQAKKLSIPSGFSNPPRAVASRSHLSTETKEYIDQLGKGKEVEMVCAGSSLKFCLVAEGKADVYPRFAPTMEWDTAAGQAVVEQAGGVVLSKESGKPVVYNKENLLNPWFIAGVKEAKA